MFFVFHYFFILDIYVTGRKRDCRRPRKRPLGVIHFASSPNIPDCFTGYKLPFSHNQEKSSNRNSLEYRARKSKYYLISWENHQKLLSSIQVPYKLRTGSSSKTRVDSSNNERNEGIAEKPSMESDERKLSGASGCFVSNIRQMASLRDTKLDMQKQIC